MNKSPFFFRKPVTHVLKCWVEFYKSVHDLQKRFEVRLNDRDFKVGDYLHIKEWDNVNEMYTGRNKIFRIMYILENFEGLKEGWVVMDIRPKN